MPAQERRPGDEAADPAVARDQAAGRREQHPVAGLVSGWARRSPEDAEVVTQDEDLEIVGTTVWTTPATDDEARESTNNEVAQGEQRPILLLC